MEEKILKLYEEFLAAGETNEMALILAQIKHFANEFRKLHSELVSIKMILAAHYGEAVLAKMDKDE